MRLLFVGDVCLANIDTDAFAIDPRIVELLERADLRIANLESPLTAAEEKAPHHPFNMKAPPRENDILAAFDVFSLANNHILDYGETGLRDTMEFLSSQNKLYFGAGLNARAALKPLLVDRPEGGLAFIGLSRWYHAGSSRPGTAPDRFRRLEPAIRHARDENRFVIACPHWNYEFIDYPSPDSVALAHRLIDAGVHLVVGSHPHIVQGYERYGGGYILYSLGNFVFHNDPQELANISRVAQFIRPGSLHETCIATFEIESNAIVGHEITPVYSDNSGLRLPATDAHREFLDRIAAISRPLENPAERRRLFYDQATNISRKSSRILSMVLRQQGPLSLIRVLSGIRKQDLKIVAHSMLLRLGLGGAAAPKRPGHE